MKILEENVKLFLLGSTTIQENLEAGASNIKYYKNKNLQKQVMEIMMKMELRLESGSNYISVQEMIVKSLMQDNIQMAQKQVDGIHFIIRCIPMKTRSQVEMRMDQKLENGLNQTNILIRILYLCLRWSTELLIGEYQNGRQLGEFKDEQLQ
ncbi:unnamed protein product [Paramecium octaurelia]|uniref:Uncharacterized protein n=1 Tax=Paramecium octaurelia TaxID=43137 RepID=A0A8S1YB86_PAROT|nr:unnamed protein product [Paramecium octaurelia]